MKKIIFLVSLIPSIALCVAAEMHKIPTSLTEALGFVTGGYCVWLTVEENIWNWPIGIANSVFFLVLFLKSRLFADSGLQVVYIVLGFLGWYWWLRGGNKRPDLGKLPVRRIGAVEALILSVLVVVATWQMDIYLDRIHDVAPFLDALTTVLSLAAQYLLTWKVLENWYVWISADLIYVGLYEFKHLYLTGILYAVFLVLCVIGVRQWQLSLKKAIALDTQPGAAAYVA